MGKVINFRRKLGEKIMKKGVLEANEVAKFFLSLESMSNKKLQKLCYYSQAWHYALYEEGLFRQDIEAWVHGPVIPEVYYKYREYRWNDIPMEASDIREQGVIGFLNMIYNTYRELSGDELEELTHSEQPWQKAREGLEEWEPSHNKIDPVLMKEYYWRKYESSQL